MANYHIKKTSILSEVGDVYYKGDNSWTDVYADRKVYTNKSTANSQKATKHTGLNNYQYQPNFWKNSTVVTE